MPSRRFVLRRHGRASQLRCELPPPPHELRSPAEPERGALCRCEQEKKTKNSGWRQSRETVEYSRRGGIDRADVNEETHLKVL